jgi:hypothetical protein
MSTTEQATGERLETAEQAELIEWAEDDRRDRVREGVAALDRYHGGPGWQAGINLDRLNVGDLAWCPVGQTFGHYDDGLRSLGIEWAVAVSYGFDNDGWETWDALTASWQAVLAERAEIMAETPTGGQE